MDPPVSLWSNVFIVSKNKTEVDHQGWSEMSYLRVVIKVTINSNVNVEYKSASVVDKCTR